MRIAGARTSGFEAVGFGVSGSRDVGSEAVDALAVGLGVLDLEIDLRALGTADPVALHGLDRLGPVDVVELVEQLLAIVGDAQEPLRDLAPFDHGAGSPAAPVDDLLVGEYGLVDGVPVHLGFPAVRDPLLEQAGEQPLLPAVVLGPAGREFAAPVVGEPELPELLLHVVDVLVRPARGRHLVLHRRVLRGEAERVPSHGLKDVAPAHALVPADHVADGVVPHVPHVQLPARIREHRQAVELLAGGIFPDLEHAVLVPEGLRLVLYRLGEIALVHRLRSWPRCGRARIPKSRCSNGAGGAVRAARAGCTACVTHPERSWPLGPPSRLSSGEGGHRKARADDRSLTPDASVDRRLHAQGRSARTRGSCVA